MQTPENNALAYSLAEALQSIQTLEQNPIVIEYMQKVKQVDDYKEKIKSEIKNGETFGEIGGHTFVIQPTLWYTPEVLFAELGDRANEYVTMKPTVDQKKVTKDIKDWLLPVDMEAKRVVVSEKILFPKTKQVEKEAFIVD